MEYHLKIDDKHKIVLSTKGSADGDFQIKDLNIDLSSYNLFSDPNRDPDTTGAEHVLLPLKDQSKSAFSLLDQVQSSSPIVSTLKSFKEKKLDQLISGLSEHTDVDISKIATICIQSNKLKINKALYEAITRIDKELPHYFKIEKELGTFKWLKSACANDKLPFSFSKERFFDPDKVLPGDLLMTDRSERYLVYNVLQKKAYTLSDKAPNSSDILAALCSSGTLGQAALEVNRAAALHIAVTPALVGAEAIKQQEESRENILKERSLQSL